MVGEVGSSVGDRPVAKAAVLEAELRAMEQAWGLFERLSHDARRRVAEWLSMKVQDEDPSEY